MPSSSEESGTLGSPERPVDSHLEKSSESPPSVEAASKPPAALLDVPDGGLRAWTVVLGATLTLFSSFGVVNSYGVFQSYYASARLTHEGESVLALLGAIQLACLYGLGPLVGKLFDAYGCSVLMPLGSFLIVFSLMMLSICQPDQLYQYFLSQAVLFGIGCAMVFTPALAVLGHWFRHRRGLALGIVAGGSSLGGVIYPITLQRLLPRIGFGWSVRVMAFIDLLCLAFACLTMRTRLPLHPQPAKSFLRFIDVGGFRDARFCLATALAFLMFYALFIPYFYIKQYAEFQGVRPQVAQYLLPIINATGIPSRILPGLLADRIGVLNLLIPMVAGSGILVLALWLPSRGEAAIVCFAAFYGLLSGGFVSLLPAYIARISPQHIYGARLGSVYAFVAVANLVGTPTAGAFVKTKTQEGFARLIGFTGALVLAGALFGAAAWAIEYRKAKREARERGEKWRWYTIPKI